VVVVVECLHPPVTRLDGEPAGDTLGREQLIPIFFAVRQAVLQVEGEVSEGLAAVGAAETLGVEVGAEGLQTVPNNLLATLAAAGGQVGSITVLTVQLALFLDEAGFLQRPPALLHVADES